MVEEVTSQKSEIDFSEKALLTVKDVCTYLSIGDTKARQLLKNPSSTFTVRLGGKLYAHKTKLDEWLVAQCSE